MIEFRCWNEDCIHNKNNNCACKELFINIGNDFPYGCDEYLSYIDTAEYQKPYYKACKDCNTGALVKVFSRGKKIVIKGEVFYTEAKDIEHNTFCTITHGRTGYGGEYQRIIDNWDALKSPFKDLPSVASYPEGRIYEGKCYKYGLDIERNVIG